MATKKTTKKEEVMVILQPMVKDNRYFYKDAAGNEFEGFWPAEKEKQLIEECRDTGKNVKIVKRSDKKLVLTRVDKVDNKPTTNEDFTEVMTKVIGAKKDTVVDTTGMSEDRAGMIKTLAKAYSMKPDILKMSELKWKYLVRSVARGKNVMMTGPAGCGKTMAVQMLAEAMKERTLHFFNLGSTQDPRATLIGSTHFDKEKGTFFSESAFVKAITTPNAIVLLDEISRAHPEAMNILMTVLDYKQRYLRLDEKDGSPIVKVADGVSFIGTANIGNEYTATRVLDRALLDRFTIVEMDVLDKAQEVELLKTLWPEVSEKEINAVASIAEATRLETKTEASKISTIVSTRATVEMCGLLNDGFSLAEAAEVAIYPFYLDEGGVSSERTFIKQIVQKYMVTAESKKQLWEMEEEDDLNYGSISDDRPF